MQFVVLVPSLTTQPRFRVADDFATGTRAALAGGTTMVVELVDPGAEQSVADALEEWREDAEQNSYCDYAFKVGQLL